ncbi:hypothetical protein ACH3Y9_14775 [Streptomyces sp. WSLK1-5]|uniref:hypothetical protein n=1 Tax=unclassified Streptomyces TaxID=2593676 RepID=UPI00379B6582
MALLRKSAAALCVAVAVLLAAPPAASAHPSPHGTLAREDFDRLPLGPVTEGRGWTGDTAGGTLSVVPGSRGHGRELRIRTDGNGRALLVFDKLSPPGNSFWGRVRLRVGGFPSAPDWAHWTIAEASGTGSATLVRPLGGQYAPTDHGNFWGVGSDLGPTGDWTSWKTSSPAVAGTWQCVEFHLDARDNRVSVYLDGVRQSDLTVSTKDHGGTADDFVFPAFDRLKLGWQLYQADPTPASYDIRMDDITLGTRRVGGCGSEG